MATRNNVGFTVNIILTRWRGRGTGGGVPHDALELTVQVSPATGLGPLDIRHGSPLSTSNIGPRPQDIRHGTPHPALALC